jgi:hypothetical protein
MTYYVLVSDRYSRVLLEENEAEGDGSIVIAHLEWFNEKG